MVVEYKTSITSDVRIIEKPVSNHICLDTGLVFNATGASGAEKEFYTDEYDLHSESVISEFKYFEKGRSVGVYSNILEFIEKNIRLNNKGNVLDIGCGKGLFLRRFTEVFSKWELFGIEPSKNASQFFSETMPNVNIFEGMLEESSYKNEKFDIITANGVLEHVPKPIEFLKTVKRMMHENSYLYIGVPNFENNPADLFTFDHLSKFTEDTISLCFDIAGFEIIAKKIESQRVPMWYILKPKLNGVRALEPQVNKSKKLVSRTLREIEGYWSSFNEAAKIVNEGYKIAFYGSGAFGSLAFHYSDISVEDISVIIDDNETVWGSKRLGIPIDAPDNLDKYKEVKAILFSANPCYLDTLHKKTTNLINSKKLECKAFLPVFS